MTKKSNNIERLLARDLADARRNVKQNTQSVIITGGLTAAILFFQSDILAWVPSALLVCVLLPVVGGIALAVPTMIENLRSVEQSNTALRFVRRYRGVIMDLADLHGIDRETMRRAALAAEVEHGLCSYELLSGRASANLELNAEWEAVASGLANPSESGPLPGLC